MAGTFRRCNNINNNNISGTANADGQYNHMSPLELELLKTMSKVETQDKQGRKVAVFFY